MVSSGTCSLGRLFVELGVGRGARVGREEGRGLLKRAGNGGGGRGESRSGGF